MAQVSGRAKRDQAWAGDGEGGKRKDASLIGVISLVGARPGVPQVPRARGGAGGYVQEGGGG